MIITEYGLPRQGTQPHDAIVDPKGIVWYADWAHQFIGKLDPRTAQVVEYPVPLLYPDHLQGSQEIARDQEGNLWLGMNEQGGIAKFDRKTQKFQVWPLPRNGESVTKATKVQPQYDQLDHKVWAGGASKVIYRLDLDSGKFETFEPFRSLPDGSPVTARPHIIYGIVADSRNNLYFMDIGSEYIGKVDAKTGKATFYQTPTANSTPRRGMMDAQERLWFAEYNANKIAMFDTKTERFQEWTVPTPWTGPYDVILDKNGEAWTAGMASDRVVRFSPKTGEFIEYLLPRSTNVRRVDVDNATNPVSFWVGNNHGASLIKLEPLE